MSAKHTLPNRLGISGGWRDEMLPMRHNVVRPVSGLRVFALPEMRETALRPARIETTRRLAGYRLSASWRAHQTAPGTGRRIRTGGGGVMVRIRWWDGAAWAVSGLLSLEEARALVEGYADATIVRDEPGWPPL